MSTVSLAPLQVLFHEGDAGDVAYVIVSGRIEIYNEDAEGAVNRIAVLNAGEMFGEMGPMDGLPRSASARALEKTVLNIIDMV
jgi:CRP-like cAMP-binding protein